MNKIFYIATILTVVLSCHENLEDRAAREAAEYTKKNCPVKIAENIINDSLVFERPTKTVHYYYSLTGVADTTFAERGEIKDAMLKGIMNATDLKVYKEAGFIFRYTYFSTKNKGKVLYDIALTEKDYDTDMRQKK